MVQGMMGQRGGGRQCVGLEIVLAPVNPRVPMQERGSEAQSDLKTQDERQRDSE